MTSPTPADKAKAHELLYDFSPSEWDAGRKLKFRIAQALADERGLIVKWLRGTEAITNTDWSDGLDSGIGHIADAIRRGDHLR